MLTIHYANGSKRVIKLSPLFFVVEKNGPSPHTKSQQIMSDLGGIKFNLEALKK